VDSKSHNPNIIYFASTRNHEYIVIVTGEDKCIHVLHLTSGLTFETKSQRSVFIDINVTPLLKSCRIMPKRPCSIVISPDDRTIFSADKFGDVITLPLLPTEEEDAAAKEAAIASAVKPYKPAATELTVHSKANLRTLQNQLKYGNNSSPKTKGPLQFAHSVILGHVSLLTDMAIATLQSRHYVITADRDEHIRISRGPPQSYVIERFCSGHEEFVNRLCVLDANRLVSGGGDDHVFIWDWTTGSLITKVNIQEGVRGVVAELGTQADGKVKIAVSGLWHVAADKDKNVSIQMLNALSNFL
jgi:tRNA (guanine-N(7)-)-methyltransferase subunit TRM82